RPPARRRPRTDAGDHVPRGRRGGVRVHVRIGEAGPKEGIMDDANKAVPSAPMPRDRGRWRVAPAPDGRGRPDEQKPPPPHRVRWFWVLLLVLLVINWAAVLMTRSSGQPRVKVPFSPYFLKQVQGGQVQSISSKGDTIDGTFARKVDYPPGS